ncbi:hypothetical protein CYG49_03865 [Candidatus Saccharibacteria bacterium]|nr:MAG: hypothetical protein CYG49_03865 [Candidatus Saccharibacteria bacterium]
MIELNLLPDVKKEFLRAQRTRNTVITGSILAIMVAVGLTVLFAVYVYGVQAAQTALLTRDIKNRASELEKKEELGKYLTIQNQLVHIDKLHEDKTVYSRLIDFLSVLNPSEPNSIQLSNLQVTTDEKSATFTGTGRSFENFNVFKDTLVNAEVVYKAAGDEGTQTEKLFDSVVVESSSLGRVRDATAVTFVVRVTFNEKAFLGGAQDVTVKVPTIETTQSVRQSPAALFNGTIDNNEEGQQ